MIIRRRIPNRSGLQGVGAAGGTGLGATKSGDKVVERLPNGPCR